MVIEFANYYSYEKLTEMGYVLVGQNFSDSVSVYKKDGEYFVFRQNILRHPKIDADGAIRALTQYVK
jgi:hypothetical protein